MFAAIDTIAAPLVLAATEAAEDEGLNPLVRVVPGLMIWTLLAFVVAMLVLRKYAWPQITRILDQRQTQMVATLERCRERIAVLERQRVDIDATIAELSEFCSFLNERLDQKDS